MADPLLPPTPDDAADEWASAIVDGLAPADVLQRAATDPALAERVARLRQVRAELARPPLVEPDTSRAAVAAVLAALDAAQGSTAAADTPDAAASSGPGPLRSTGTAAAGVAGGRRSRWRRPVAPLAGAAAAVALLVAGAAAVLVSQDREQLATSGDAAMFESATANSATAGAAPMPADAAARGSSTAGGAGAEQASRDAVGPVVDLGVLADDASLRRAALAALAPSAEPSTRPAPPTTAKSDPGAGSDSGATTAPPTAAELAASEGRCASSPLAPGPRAIAVVAGRRVAVTVTGTDVFVLDLAQCAVRRLPT
jgi:hypothetical protein